MLRLGSAGRGTSRGAGRSGWALRTLYALCAGGADESARTLHAWASLRPCFPASCRVSTTTESGAGIATLAGLAPAIEEQDVKSVNTAMGTTRRPRVARRDIFILFTLTRNLFGCGWILLRAGDTGSAEQSAYRETPIPALYRLKEVRHTVGMIVASALVVEDDTFSRTLITSTLQSHHCEVVASTASASHALAAARKHPVDVALLDLDLGPGPTGFDLAAVLRREFPRLGIVFLTSYQDPRILVGARATIPVGARFVQKSGLVDPGALITTISQAKRTPRIPQPWGGPPATALTAHQMQVLKMVAEGKSTKEIAQQTGVSGKAVEASISRVRKILSTEAGDSGNARVELARAYWAMTGRSAPRG